MADSSKRTSSRGRTDDDDGLGKRPSIVMLQENPKQQHWSEDERSRPASSSASSGVLNPAVKNRTGRPSTEKGKLADSNRSVNAEAYLKQPTSPSVSSQGRRPSANRRSSATLSSRTSGYKSMNSESSSGNGSGGNGVRDQIKMKMSLENTFGKATTPSSVARQREIQRKMRKEKAEVEAKYEDSAHNSALRNSDGGELFPMAQSRAPSSRSASRTSLSSAERRKSYDPSDRITLIKSARKGSRSTMPPPSRKSSTDNGRFRSAKGRGSQGQVLFDGNATTGDGSNSSSGGDGRQNGEGSSGGQDSEANNDNLKNPDNTGSDSSLFDLDLDLSLTTLEYLDFEEHDSNRSRFFPKISELSSSNFTNLRFSYFKYPGHVKEHNNRISTGWFKLPKLDELNGGIPSASGGNRRRRGSVGKSNLLRRIEKLNQAGNKKE